MDLLEVVDRLKKKLTGVREIDLAADIESVLQSGRVAPAVYVLPLSEQAKHSRSTARVTQEETLLFGVLQIVETRSPKGESGLVALEALRAQIKAALVGWVPSAADGEPVVMAGGELVELRPSRLCWSDEFFKVGYYHAPINQE